MKKLKVHRNGDDGFQVEFQGVLLTVRKSEQHGIFGIVCLVQPGGKEIREITFHGESPLSPFPVEIHDEIKDLPQN